MGAVKNRTSPELAANPITRARAGLAETVSEITGFGVSASIPTGAAPLPIGFVEVRSTDALTTGHNTVAVAAYVVLIFAASDYRVAQESLDALLLGPKSVRAAVHHDRTLRGTVSSAAVKDSRTLGLVEVGGVKGFAHEWTVTMFVEDKK